MGLPKFHGYLDTCCSVLLLKHVSRIERVHGIWGFFNFDRAFGRYFYSWRITASPTHWNSSTAGGLQLFLFVEFSSVWGSFMHVPIGSNWIDFLNLRHKFMESLEFLLFLQQGFRVYISETCSSSQRKHCDQNPCSQVDKLWIYKYNNYLRPTHGKPVKQLCRMKRK